MAFLVLATKVSSTAARPARVKISVSCNEPDHMRRCAFGSDEVKESSHVNRAYPVRFPLHAVVCF
jgi:hypothetical protein